jgi:hypothetical protein
MIDPAFLKWSSERRAIDMKDEVLQEALGGLELKPAGEMEIEELRVRNVPAEVLVKYICDTTNFRYWIYQGDVYLNPYESNHSAWRFFSEEVIDRVHFDYLPLDQLDRASRDIAARHEYHGHKTGITIFMSKNGREALRKGEVALPIVNLDLRKATLEQAMEEVARQGGASLVAHPSGALVFNPLNEAENPNPFDRVEGRADFNYILDDDWNKPGEKDPFE